MVRIDASSAHSGSLSEWQDGAPTYHQTLDLQRDALPAEGWERMFEDTTGERYLAFGQ